MPIRVRGVLALAALLSAPWASRAENAPSEAALRSTLSNVRPLSSLTETGFGPWHLHASFDLFDAKGQPTDHGSMEEWWASPTQWRIQISSPGYTSLLTKDGDHVYRTSGTASLPASIALLLRQFTDPALAQERIDRSKPSLESKEFGKVKLDCIMVAPERAKQPPFGLYPTYCFNPGTSMLRLSANFGTQVVIRNKGGRFREKAVALDLTVNEKNVLSSKAQVDTLTSYTPQPNDFAPTAAQEPLASDNPVTIQAGVVAGSLIDKVPPVYPEKARMYGIHGSVILAALIGSDGHIQDLEPISSPDDLLTTAAVAAVRQWVYKPYLLNGQPVEVRTTITVNFNMSR